MNPIPLPYRLLAIGLLILTLFAAGYGLGWSHEHDKLVAFKAMVEQVGKTQAEQAKLTEATQNEQTQIIASTYSADNARLRAALGRLRQPGSDTSTLPKPSGNPEGIDDATGEPSRACKSSQFYANALEDALKVSKFQEWVIRERIPTD